MPQQHKRWRSVKAHLVAGAVGIITLLSAQQSVAAGTCQADVVFLMDNTGSMSSMISSTRTNAATILNSISGGDERFEGIDVQYGLATYWGDPLEYAGSGGDTTSYHCPSSFQYSGKTNTISLDADTDYYLDMIDTWGDGWNGNQWKLKQGGTTLISRGSDFKWGKYKSGGIFSVETAGSYEATIEPYGPTKHWWGSSWWPYWGYEVRWRFCAVGDDTEDDSTGFPEIAGKAFKVNQVITETKADVISSMSEWSAFNQPPSYGGDWPEANYFALHQLATEGAITDGKCADAYTGTCTDMGYKTGDAIGWREESGKVIVWFGDARSHCSTVDANEAIDALLAKNIVVAAINTKSSSYGIDTATSCSGASSSVGQATIITDATKGTLTNNVSGSDKTVDAILDAVSKGIAQAGSGAGVTFSTSSLKEGTQLFQTTFDSKDWSGDLVAYNLNDDGSIDSTPAWRAATELDTTAAEDRTIITWAENQGVPFQWDSLAATQKADLQTGPTGKTESEAIGQARLQYLRGDRANESPSGLSFRTRGGRLGDIWHSSAIYVGKPDQAWPDSGAGFPEDADKYSTFVTAKTERTPIVYAGANDGLLHGFNAADGKEVLAYAPGNLYNDSISAGYHRLTDPTFNHENLYVDGTPTVSDAFVRTTSGGLESWHSILIGTQGGGGRGLFALDVTSPDSATFRETNAANLAIWEFTNSHDAHLGYTYSRPIIALLNNGRWAAITGNGLNDTAIDSTGGQAQLFIIYLDGGIDGTWTEGSDYLRINTGSGATSSRNGLFDPAVIDLDNNGTADRVYAGDLNGNLWVFDLSGSSDSAWTIAHSTNPLFAGQSSQPITVAPTVIHHPTVTNGSDPNLMILFGTGRFISDADKTITDTQSFYAVWDNGTGNLDRSSLVSQSFVLNDDIAGRVTDTDLEIAYSATSDRQYGWYIDLPASGERVVSKAVVVGNIVYFNTIIPDESVCSSGGTGWEMSVKTINGGSPDKAVFDFDGDGIVNKIKGGGDQYTIIGADGEEYSVGYAGRKLDPDKGMPAGPSIIGNQRFTAGSATETGEEIAVNAISESEATVSGRLSWDQLFPD